MNQNLNTITESIIGCAYTLANALGHGFIEKIYENALNHELSKNGLRVDFRQRGVILTLGEFWSLIRKPYRHIYE